MERIFTRPSLGRSVGRPRLAGVTEMTYRRLGDSGLQVSTVGIGTNAFSRRVDQDGVEEIVAACRDVGVTLVDTSDSYGDPFGASEEMIGRALEGQRDEFVLATKFSSGQPARDHGPGGSRRYIVRAVEDSLRRLRTDRIDLYQYHFPDETTPIEETLSALTDLVRAGKVLYVGCSNFSGWQVADADWTARTGGYERFVSAQNHYSLLERGVEDELVPACEEFGLGLLPYFPLAYGLLTGKYARGADAPAGSRAALDAGRATWLQDADWDRIEALAAYAEKRSLSLLDVAIGGLAAQPVVASVISGVTRGDQVRANAAALRWEPTAEDLVELDELTS
jgi:aryl-alcohol dehydrogenase-like predicted oxidoreductase